MGCEGNEDEDEEGDEVGCYEEGGEDRSEVEAEDEDEDGSEDCWCHLHGRA